ncbi:MAG: hypothetical protein Q8R92_13620 [Deltaproteobacteria bacterium]|nr:hypothetical protein [Deltaproteobacteria bacterium]
MVTKPSSILMSVVFLISTSGCFHMKHSFDGTVYFNRIPDAKREGHLDKEQMMGFALYGLVPYEQEPTRSLVASSGREISNLEIETQFTAMDHLVAFFIALATFGLGNIIYETRTIKIEGDYIDPAYGPAPLDAVYE